MTGLRAVPAEQKTTDTAKVTLTLTPEGGRMIIDAQGASPVPPPVYFSATAEQIVRLTPAEVVGEMKLKLHVVQGRRKF